MQLTELKFRFKYSLSAADKKINEGYQQGLANALKRFNVDHVILSTVEKKLLEDTYLIVACDKYGHEVGGIRIEIKSAVNRIPLEKSRTPYSSIIQNKISKLTESNETVGEICGLWVDPIMKGHGLGPRLALEATMLGLDLGIDTLVAMLPSHTLDFFKRLGFVETSDIPPMAYPDDRYISTVVWFVRPEPAKLKVAGPVPQNEQIQYSEMN